MDNPAASDEQFLLSYLRERDIACPVCGYNVRALTQPRCPECGGELTLRLSAVEPRQRLMIAGLIGLSAGAGMNGLLVVYGLIQLARFSMSGQWRQFFGVTGTGFAVLGGLLCLWLVLWTRIRRCPLGVRALLTSLCWVASIADLVAFAFLIK